MEITNVNELFEQVQATQTAFWEALSALEEATGLEIDGTQDLNDWTLEDLRKSADGDDSDDEDEQEIPTCEACSCPDGTCQHAS